MYLNGIIFCNKVKTKYAHILFFYYFVDEILAKNRSSAKIHVIKADDNQKTNKNVKQKNFDFGT